MDREMRDRLFESIKKDDARSFGAFLTPEVLGAVFGRFPLLSLLYLYDAGRIVKQHFAELVKERPRIKAEPIREAEERFRTVAGKALRHYADREVSPLEMLAVLGRGRELKKVYAVYPNASRYLTAIHKVYYTRLGKGVSVTGEQLDLPAEPLPYAERRHSFLFACICLALGVAFAAVTAFVSLWFGLGTSASAYKVRDVGSLSSALEADLTVSLEKDVTLSLGVESYHGTFEGNDHLVRLHAPFAETFEGELRNVIFVLESDFTGDGVILENKGTLKNVRVVAEDYSCAKGGEFMGLLTSVNKGTIEGCYAVLSVEITGDAGGDCYFAPFAGSNEGVIHDCHTEGTISAINADVAGIAGKNEKNGTITDCVVDATLSESADIKGWTPNVGGITDHNDGTIYGCEVQGSVLSVLLSPELEEEDHILAAYAAGVACVNTGSITRVTNRAAVTAESTNGVAFAGGIVTLNTTLSTDQTASGNVEHCLGHGAIRAVAHTENNSYAGGIAALNESGSTISSSGQDASVYAESPDRYYDFTGGIVGNNRGYVETSFFLGSFSGFDEDSLVGAICGMSYLYNDAFFMSYALDLANNAFVRGAVYACGALQQAGGGAIYSAAQFVQAGNATGVALLGYGSTAAESAEALKAMGIYYE